MISPLTDASGVRVGEMFVMKDISETKAAHWRLLAIGFGVLLVLLAGLFAFLFVLLRRTRCRHPFPAEGSQRQRGEIPQHIGQHAGCIF